VAVSRYFQVREVTIGVGGDSATVLTLVVTAVVLVRWKPSARSRSLSGIFSLSAPPTRIEPAQRLRSLRSPRAHLALPVRQDMFCGDGYRPFNVETACATKSSLVD
jgi:hypothetical protein